MGDDGQDTAPEFGRRDEDDRWWPRFKHNLSANRGAVLASIFFLMLGAAGSRLAVDLWGAPATAERADRISQAILNDSLPAIRRTIQRETRSLRLNLNNRFDQAVQQRRRMYRMLCRLRQEESNCEQEAQEVIDGGR